MGFINAVLGIPLGYVIYLAYRATGSYGLAILIFAILVKFVMFPLMLANHNNSIRLLQLQPLLDKIKRRYKGDRERLNEEQYELFKKEKYSPMLGVVPLVFRLILIVGVMQVMYNPLQHMLRLDGAVIDAMVAATQEITGIYGGSGEHLRVLEAIQNPQNIPVFQGCLRDFDASDIIQAAANIDLSFIGVDLGRTPSFANPSAELFIPLVSVIVAFVFCIASKKLSPGALSQGRGANYGFTVTTVGLTLYFTLVMPAGVGVYWTVSNLLGIAAVFILDAAKNPKTLAGDALAYLDSVRKTPEQLRHERLENKELKARSKRDAAKFTAAKKRLVFYAISGGQYKYYKQIIEHILERSDLVIHYLTNDPQDAVFAKAGERIVPYFATQQRTIRLMLWLDADIMVTTVPDLQSFYMKRSTRRDDIEYIHVPHGLASSHLMARENAFDHFDTIFCVGPHRVKEMRRREEMAGLPPKTLVKAGSAQHDQLVLSYANMSAAANEKPRILIAPSWQNDNILELCINELLDSLLGKGYAIAVRPHPQFVQMFPERMDALTARYKQYADEITFEDFSGNESIYTSDILITDWSNIAFEFSYCTLKPCVFINTPMKVMNPSYKQYGLEVLDITLRDKVGVSVDIGDLGKLGGIIDEVMTKKEAYKEEIARIVGHYVYHPGRSGEAGGTYIMNRLKLKS